MTLPGDYDSEDGWNDQNSVEQCPHCETVFSANGGHLGPVYDQCGREFDTYLDTDPSKGPFFCLDCWAELETNRKAAENKTLEEFA